MYIEKIISLLLLFLFTCNSFAEKQKSVVITPPPIGNSFIATMARLYIETSTKDKGDGIIEFLSLFQNSASKKPDISFGSRDNFKKITYFTSADSTLSKYEPEALTMYLAIPDCKLPIFFISARAFRNSWIFINRVSILSDGVPALDMSITLNDKPNRKIYPNGSAEETVDLALTEKQIIDLRKVENAKRVNVRITGSDGYITFSNKEAVAFQNDLAGSLRVYDALARMVTEKHYDSCN